MYRSAKKAAMSSSNVYGDGVAFWNAGRKQAFIETRGFRVEKTPFYDEEESFWNNAAPELEDYYQAWRAALCESPFRKELADEFGEIIFTNMEIERRTFDTAIIPLLQQENELVTEYEKLIAGARIPFLGKTYTIAQMDAFKNTHEDDIRLSAWKTEGQWYRDNQQRLDEIYDRLDVGIHREKQLKGWHRGWKDKLINDFNPEWKDLAEDIGVDPEYIQAVKDAYDSDSLIAGADPSFRPLIPPLIRPLSGQGPGTPSFRPLSRNLQRLGCDIIKV